MKVSLVTEDEKLNHPFILKSQSTKLLELERIDLLNEDSDVNKYGRFQFLYQINRKTNTAILDGLNIISISTSKILKSLGKGVKQGLFQNAQNELMKFGDLNRCKLKFEAVTFSMRTKGFKSFTEPKFSNVIENYKIEMSREIGSPEEPLLIRCASKQYARYNISEEIFLLSSYISRDDILIEFLQFDKKNTEEVVWLKIAQLNRLDVFCNCALIFTNPIYDFFENPNEPLPLMTKVFFRLYRPSTKTHSNLMEFYYIKDNSNYLDSYPSIAFLKHCATNSENKAIKNHTFKSPSSTQVIKENKNVDIKEEKEEDEVIEEDAPKSLIKKSTAEQIQSTVSDQKTIVETQTSMKEEKMEIDSENKISETIPTTKKETKKKEENKQVKKTVQQYREMLEECEKKMNGLADRTSSALLKVSETRSLYSLIGTQRFLLSAQNDEGNTPIHIAIANSNFDILEVFVDIVTTIDREKNDTDMLNIKNFNQLTPLLMAAHQKETEVCKYLLESGAEIYCADATGSSCFHIACKNNDSKLLKGLFEFIVEAGKRLSSIEAILNKPNYDGLTPLHVAVKLNHMEVIQMLLQTGFMEINKKSMKDGMSALNLAAKFGHFKIVELLLNQPKIDVNSKSNSGLTALHFAVINKSYFIVKRLLTSKANLFEETEKCMNLKCKIVKCKLENSISQKIDINSIRDPTKDIKLILEYSETHYNAYHYANNDEIMYYLFKNEKMIPKPILNKILLAETRNALKVQEKQLDFLDKELKSKIFTDNEFDIVSLIEKRMKDKTDNLNNKLTKSYMDEQIGEINTDMHSLNIDETLIPLLIENI